MSNLVSNGDVMVGWAIAIGLCVLGFLYWNATRQINNSKDILNTRGFPEKSRYPIITPETFAPLGVPISTTDAKKLYKQVMQIIGFVEKGDMADSVRYLAEAMKQREDELKDEYTDEKNFVLEEIQFDKECIQELKADLKAAKTDDERTAIAIEISELEENIAQAQKRISEGKAAFDAFKTDKRAFLVEYMNCEIHGQDWRSKC